METRLAIKDAAEKLTLDEWIELVGQSLVEPKSVAGIPLPGAPSPELQAAYVGSSGPDAIREAAPFYRYVLDANRKHRGAPIGRLLDFGCGWGRYTRLFAREVPEEGLYGADPDPLAIRVCRLYVPFGCFVRSTTRPPLPFRDQFFDVVVAYSVFSHLSELNAANWVYELSRVLKPGGLFVASTFGPWLLDRVQRLKDGVVPCTTKWDHTLVRVWKDVAAARARYERGEFVVSEAGEYPDRDGYGDALVPRQYVWEVWGKLMEPLEYLSDPTADSQTAFVLRRPLDLLGHAAPPGDRPEAASEADRLRAALAAAEGQRDALLRSRSWSLTRPLRATRLAALAAARGVARRWRSPDRGRSPSE